MLSANRRFGKRSAIRAYSTWYHAMPRPQKLPLTYGDFLVELN